MLRPSPLAALLLLLAFVVAGTPFAATPAGQATPATPASVLGVQPEQLQADYWIARAPDPQRVLLDARGIAHLDARLRQTSPSLIELAALPDVLDAEGIRADIDSLSAVPTRTLFDAEGRAVTAGEIDALRANLALDSLTGPRAVQFALVVHRADLRSFPTRRRVFRERGDTDIDRWQESALFPGTPVAVLHTSRDGEWAFVASPDYRAWIERRHLAGGDRATVLAYRMREPALVVTGATARTVHAPKQPEISDLQLDMGVRLPRRADWPPDEAVHGQHPAFGHVVDLPTRSEDGRLAFTPALLPHGADVATGYLPLTRANLLRQAFKFLGERYGWGHGYDARDCSGFVAEVHRSFGLHLPRNTGDQASAPALQRTGVDPATGHAERLALLAAARVGDLVYVPGHVMMVVGHVDGAPWVIHDIHGMHLGADDGGVRRLAINAVAVTPLLPMRAEDGQPMVDRITAIQRVAP